MQFGSTDFWSGNGVTDPTTGEFTEPVTGYDTVTPYQNSPYTPVDETNESFNLGGYNDATGAFTNTEGITLDFSGLDSGLEVVGNMVADNTLSWAKVGGDAARFTLIGTKNTDSEGGDSPIDNEKKAGGVMDALKGAASSVAGAYGKMDDQAKAFLWSTVLGLMSQYANKDALKAASKLTNARTKQIEFDMQNTKDMQASAGNAFKNVKPLTSQYKPLNIVPIQTRIGGGLLNYGR